MSSFARPLFCGILSALALASAAPAQEDPKEIVRRSLKVDHRNEELRRNYTWKVLTVVHEIDSAGNPKASHSTLAEVLPIAGRPYTHVLEKDGKPLPPEEAQKAQEMLDYAVKERSRLSPEERRTQADKFKQRRSKEREQMQYIPEAFDLRLVGESTIGGRPAWQIQASPRRDYKGPHAFLFRNMEGTLWIDKQDYEWVKVEADALDTISIGWFIARIAKGNRVAFENFRVNDELWAPKYVAIRASARIALFKKLSASQEQTFSEYRKFQTDSRLVSPQSSEQ